MWVALRCVYAAAVELILISIVGVYVVDRMKARPPRQVNNHSKLPALRSVAIADISGIVSSPSGLAWRGVLGVK